MKRDAAMMIMLFSLSSLGLGMVIGLRISLARPAIIFEKSSAMTTPPQTTAPPPALQPDNREEFDCVELPSDHPLRAKLNGKRLPLNYAGLEKDDKKQSLKDAKVEPLADGRLLVGLGDTLYMLDSAFNIQWRYKPNWIIFDFAFVESTGLIYGAAGDSVLFIVEAATGKQLWARGYNGRAGFVQAVPYGRDECLIIHSMAGYRESLDEWKNARRFFDRDGVIAYRGTKRLWAADWPPDAELVVGGDNIYAVTKTDAGIYVRKIRLSRLKKY